MLEGLLGTARDANSVQAMGEMVKTLMFLMGGLFVLVIVMFGIVLDRIEKIKRQLEDRDLRRQAQLSAKIN